MKFIGEEVNILKSYDASYRPQVIANGVLLGVTVLNKTDALLQMKTYIVFTLVDDGIISNEMFDQDELRFINLEEV